MIHYSKSCKIIILNPISLILTSNKEYINWGNNETIVGVMIETKEAVESIDEIIAVNGLDFILFGYADYSLSIGLSEPNKSHKEVQKVIDKTAESALKYKKYTMIGIDSPWKEEAEKYIKTGYKLIEIGADYSLFY